jgi:predicted GIY-YIG superfamily endonuclease
MASVPPSARRLTQLVYAEHHGGIDDAIVREKAMKAWKLRQIMEMNSNWDDLFETING